MADYDVGVCFKISNFLHKMGQITVLAARLVADDSLKSQISLHALKSSLEVVSRRPHLLSNFVPRLDLDLQ